MTELTDAMLSRGSADLSFAQMQADLDFRGISLNVADGYDVTQLDCSCTSDQVDFAMQRTRQVLLQPTFPEDQFKQLKEQSLNGLLQARENPTTVAMQELYGQIYGQTPLGRHSTPETLSQITLDQVRAWYARLFQPAGAMLVFSGDITPERAGIGQAVAGELEGGRSAPPVDYTSGGTAGPKIILIDRPSAVQSVVRMAIPAYDIHDDGEKFAGSIAGQILSAGIDSRLGKYVRAEKGLAYAVTGVFQPNRHAGLFVGSTDTDVKLTGDAIAAMFKVFDDMRQDDVSPKELSDAQQRVAGGMVMNMQTIDQQASLRGEGILNGYPIDYYDRYGQRTAEVTADQVRAVMQKYVNPNQFVIVVVGPADRVKDQLSRFGTVEVLPMPARRGAASSEPSGELLTPTK